MTRYVICLCDCCCQSSNEVQSQNIEPDDQRRSWCNCFCSASEETCGDTGSTDVAKSVSLESLSLEIPINSFSIKTKTSSKLMHSYVTKNKINCKRCGEGLKKYMAQQDYKLPCEQKTTSGCSRTNNGRKECTEDERKYEEEYKKLYESDKDHVKEMYFKMFKDDLEKCLGIDYTKRQEPSEYNEEEDSERLIRITTLKSPSPRKIETNETVFNCDNSSCGTNCPCIGGCDKVEDETGDDDVIQSTSQQPQSRNETNKHVFSCDNSSCGTGCPCIGVCDKGVDETGDDNDVIHSTSQNPQSRNETNKHVFSCDNSSCGTGCPCIVVCDKGEDEIGDEDVIHSTSQKPLSRNETNKHVCSCDDSSSETTSCPCIVVCDEIDDETVDEIECEDDYANEDERTVENDKKNEHICPFQMKNNTNENNCGVERITNGRCVANEERLERNNIPVLGSSVEEDYTCTCYKEYRKMFEKLQSIQESMNMRKNSSGDDPCYNGNNTRERVETAEEAMNQEKSAYDTPYSNGNDAKSQRPECSNCSCPKNPSRKDEILATDNEKNPEVNGDRIFVSIGGDSKERDTKCKPKPKKKPCTAPSNDVSPKPNSRKTVNDKGLESNCVRPKIGAKSKKKVSKPNSESKKTSNDFNKRQKRQGWQEDIPKPNKPCKIFSTENKRPNTARNKPKLNCSNRSGDNVEPKKNQNSTPDPNNEESTACKFKLQIGNLEISGSQKPIKLHNSLTYDKVNIQDKPYNPADYTKQEDLPERFYFEGCAVKVESCDKNNDDDDVDDNGKECGPCDPSNAPVPCDKDDDEDDFCEQDIEVIKKFSPSQMQNFDSDSVTTSANLICTPHSCPANNPQRSKEPPRYPPVCEEPLEVSSSDESSGPDICINPSVISSEDDIPPDIYCDLKRSDGDHLLFSSNCIFCHKIMQVCMPLHDYLIRKNKLKKNNRSSCSFMNSNGRKEQSRNVSINPTVKKV